MLKNVHAIILAGTFDFGRCKIASQKPVCLWPVMNKPAIVRILEWLQNSGIQSATICLDGDYSILAKEIDNYDLSFEIDYLTETLPWGTGGCVREVIQKNAYADAFLVSKAAMTLPPSVPELIEDHVKSDKLLTVAINPAQKSFYEATGAYICSRKINDFIPKLGYCDIKERLIPSMIQKEQNINAYILKEKTGPFRDTESYFYSVQYLLPKLVVDFSKSQDKYDLKDNDILIAKSAKIADNVRIFGPVTIHDNTCIADNTVIFGPTTIAQNVSIAPGTFIESSIIWDNTSIGSKSEIKHCLINSNTKLPSKTCKNYQVIST